MTHRRLLLLGAVALEKGRYPRLGPVMVEICDEWEPKLTAAQFLRGAPFKTIHLIIEVGSDMSERPRFRRIDRRNQELPATFEVPMNDLRFATPEAVKEMLARATRLTLREVAARYRLPTLPDLDG